MLVLSSQRQNSSRDLISSVASKPAVLPCRSSCCRRQDHQRMTLPQQPQPSPLARELPRPLSLGSWTCLSSAWDPAPWLPPTKQQGRRWWSCPCSLPPLCLTPCRQQPLLQVPLLFTCLAAADNVFLQPLHCSCAFAEARSQDAASRCYISPIWIP